MPVLSRIDDRAIAPDECHRTEVFPGLRHPPQQFVDALQAGDGESLRGRVADRKRRRGHAGRAGQACPEGRDAKGQNFSECERETMRPRPAQ